LINLSWGEGLYATGFDGQETEGLGSKYKGLGGT
jgi:hypothetical protein